MPKNRNVKIHYSPIFIVALPRSGSTLLYQLLANKFELCYLSNIMMNYLCVYKIIAKFGSYFNGCSPSDKYKSSYGETIGWNNVNQGYRLWNKLFPDNLDYIDSGVLNELQRKKIYKSVEYLQKNYQAPFINKWQKQSLRIKPLYETFPNITFIYLKRDLNHVAQSLLHGRRTLLGDEKKWLSAKPRDYMVRNQSPIEQVCEQAYFLEKVIEEDLDYIGRENVYCVEYFDLCENPNNTLLSFKEFYDKKNRYNLKIRNSNRVNLSSKIKKNVNDYEYNLIKKHLNYLRLNGS